MKKHFSQILRFAVLFGIIVLNTGQVSILSSLQKKLDDIGVANIFITIAHSPMSIYEEFSHSTFETRSAKAIELIRRLKEHAQITQRPIHDLLNQFGNQEYQSYWISNRIYVPASPAALVSALQARNEISEILEELNFPLEPITASSSERVTPIPWGVSAIGAPAVWARGFTGTGVIVGHIDTGVLGTHVDLISTYIGLWSDPGGHTTSPNDQVGHGTHTMGTILGQNGIGVAPGAKWLSCKGCTTNGCSQSDLLSCGQFVLCPDTSCEKIPDVVNNSWGTNGVNTFYETTILAWKAVYIFPVFANGNNGPLCGTSGSPGRSASVVSVGATAEDNTLANFSSRSLSAILALGSPVVTYKPDVSAPGVNVLSAWNTGDTAYNTISGTSMAAPHVTGTIALILSARPEYAIDYTNTKSVLLTGSTQSQLVRPLIICEVENADPLVPLIFPNNEFGTGFINADNSVSQALL